MNKHVYISEAYIPKGKRWTYTEEESPSGVSLVLEGEFQRAGSQNKNGRVYSQPLLERETGKLIQHIDDRNGLPMGMDHPIAGYDDPNAMTYIQRIGMENACALNTALDMQGDIVYGKAKILAGDFGTGDKLATFVKAGFLPAVSSRGVGGEPIQGANGLIMVPEDYQMICYDFVTNPSTHNAILQEAVNEERIFLESQNKYTKSLWEVIVNFTKTI